MLLESFLQFVCCDGVWNIFDEDGGVALGAALERF
jgi:hypothetical protein